MEKNKIRLGLLLDSFLVTAWEYHLVERIIKGEYAVISLVIVKGIAASVVPNGSPLPFIRKLDEAIFQVEPDPFANKDLKEILRNITVYKVESFSPEGNGYFHRQDIDAVKSHGLDILIRLGFEEIHGDMLRAAKYGIWSYYHGDPVSFRSTLPGFWEVVNKIPETGSMLYIMADDGCFGKVLYRSWFQTYLRSPARNKAVTFWSASSFVPRQVELLFRLGEKDFFAHIEKYGCKQDNGHCPEYKSPSPLHAFLIYAKLYFEVARDYLERLFYNRQWRLFIHENNQKEIIPDFHNHLREITPPKDRFWADPQAFLRKDKTYIFVEEYQFKSQKGHISVVEMDKTGSYQAPVPILSRKYHLSYPFVFCRDGEYFMIPESAGNRTIELYECVKFPFEWKFKMNLMENIRAVDTTLFYKDNLWWLFTGITENDGSFPTVELFLFYSKDLFSNHWTYHILNPVVSDVKKARPAGKIFTKNGKIYRPSQDCSRTYGWGIDFNEILKLSETEYEERKTGEIRPNWDEKIIATHSFSQTEEITVIDGLRKQRKIL